MSQTVDWDHYRKLSRDLTPVNDPLWGPEDYRQFLIEIGFGQLPSGFHLYSGPVEPNEICPSFVGSTDWPNLMFIGDDGVGYSVGLVPSAGYILEFDAKGEFVSRVSDDFLNFVDLSVVV
ncbi:MAG: hypothetical protein HRT45_03605 [Bdellovibrionales bacterium]|nr:hypothetical protein [Bdellovibrionales bacterium]